MTVDAEIFASVGSMFPFERFVRGVDEWARRHPSISVLIQIGRGKYEPTTAKFVRLMPPPQYLQCIRHSRLFIAHAGMGSIMAAMETSKPLLMMPRQMSLGEHTSEHQLATVARFGSRTGFYVALTEDELFEAIDGLLTRAATPEPISTYADTELIDAVRKFIYQA